VNNRLEIGWVEAALTAGMTDAVAIEPPESGPEDEREHAFERELKKFDEPHDGRAYTERNQF
jgi:hypothetical protein